MRLKIKSAYSDFKTGFVCKFFIVLGIIFLGIYLLHQVVPNLFLSPGIANIVIAFAILFLGIGILLYFISCQFAKLAKIAEDVETTDLEGCDQEEVS